MDTVLMRHEDRKDFQILVLTPSSVFHVVMYLNVIGRDSWEWEVSLIRNRVPPKNFGKLSL